MYIDEMVKIKNPGKNPKFSQRDREIRAKWCDMKEDGASEEELKNFVKSLTDDEFNIFVKTIGHNPLLPKVISWRES